MTPTVLRPGVTADPMTEIEVPIIEGRTLPQRKIPVATISLFEVAKAMLLHMGCPARRSTAWELPDGSMIQLSVKRSTRVSRKLRNARVADVRDP